MTILSSVTYEPQLIFMSSGCEGEAFWYPQQPDY